MEESVENRIGQLEKKMAVIEAQIQLQPKINIEDIVAEIKNNLQNEIVKANLY